MVTHTISELITNPEISEDNYYEFYDWFCNESSLRGKLLKTIPKLKHLIKLGYFDPDKTRIILKNCLPMFGNLYDMFWIRDIETDSDLYSITPSCGHKSSKGECTIYDLKEDKEHTFSSWSEFKKLKEKLQ